MSNTREKGYYWVKWGCIWHPAFYIGNGWMIAGNQIIVADQTFDKISKRKLEEPPLASISKAQFFLAGVCACATVFAILDLIINGI